MIKIVFKVLVLTNDSSMGFSVAQLVKNLPAVWETWVQSLGWEDLLEKGMATHSSILAPPKKGGSKKYFGLPWRLRG